jgi:hypothetical protein
MKITPDASLFQALSNFPRVNRDSVNPAPRQAQENKTRISTDEQSRQAILQEALRQQRAAVERAQQSHQANFSGQLAQNDTRSTSPYNREAPGVDPRPAFKRLGQIIDISV